MWVLEPPLWPTESESHGVCCRNLFLKPMPWWLYAHWHLIITPKEVTSKYEYLSWDILNWNRKEGKEWKEQIILKLWENFKKCSICGIRIPEGGDEKEAEKYLSNNGQFFSKNIGNHQIIDPGSSENDKEYKYKKKKMTSMHLLFKVNKTSDKLKFFKQVGGGWCSSFSTEKRG